MLLCPSKIYKQLPDPVSHSFIVQSLLPLDTILFPSGEKAKAFISLEYALKVSSQLPDSVFHTLIY